MWIIETYSELSGRWLPVGCPGLSRAQLEVELSVFKGAFSRVVPFDAGKDLDQPLPLAKPPASTAGS